MSTRSTVWLSPRWLPVRIHVYREMLTGRYTLELERGTWDLVVSLWRYR
jgi:hypothetical protein